ncbi:Uncharacterised protein at_DN1899 [Pycnogonum litorale]
MNTGKSKTNCQESSHRPGNNTSRLPTNNKCWRCGSTCKHAANNCFSKIKFFQMQLLWGIHNLSVKLLNNAGEKTRKDHDQAMLDHITSWNMIMLVLMMIYNILVSA